MKNIIMLALLGIVGLLGARPARADMGREPTFVSVSSAALSGGASSTTFAFVNGASNVDVMVQKIEIMGCSTTTVAGGLMQYWLYLSTTITNGGTSQAGSYRLQYPNGTAPASVVLSTGATGAVIENGQSAQPPFATCQINNDETATSNIRDTCFDASQWANPQPIKLPRGQNRGIVFVQKRLGTADVSDGCVMARMTFTAIVSP